MRYMLLAMIIGLSSPLTGAEVVKKADPCYESFCPPVFSRKISNPTRFSGRKWNSGGILLRGASVKRAERRRTRAFLKRKRSGYWGRTGCPVETGRKLNCPKPQSTCCCCCNPRKFEGGTRKEKKSSLSMKEQVSNL